MKTVWIYYLMLPDNLDDMSDLHTVTDFKQVKGVLLNLSKRYNEETETWYYLYAYTTKKNLAEKFEKLHRKDIFYLKKQRMDKEEYREFKRKNLGAKLLYYKPEEYPDKMQRILCTESETAAISEDFMLLMNSDLMELCVTNCAIFQKKYRKALDVLGYVGCYTMNFESDEMVDLYSYNASYGINYLGDGMHYVSILPNISAMYLKYFRLLLDLEDKTT